MSFSYILYKYNKKNTYSSNDVYIPIRTFLFYNIEIKSIIIILKTFLINVCYEIVVLKLLDMFLYNQYQSNNFTL